MIILHSAPSLVPTLTLLSRVMAVLLVILFLPYPMSQGIEPELEILNPNATVETSLSQLEYVPLGSPTSLQLVDAGL